MMNGVNNKVINFIFGIILPIQRLVSKLIKNFFIFFNKQTYRNKIFISIAIAGYLFLIYHNYWVHFSKDSPFNDPKSLAYLEDFMSRASYFSETEFLNKNYFNLNFLTCKIFIFTLFLNKNYFTSRVFNFLLLIISLHFNNNFDSSNLFILLNFNLNEFLSNNLILIPTPEYIYNNLNNYRLCFYNFFPLLNTFSLNNEFINYTFSIFNSDLFFDYKNTFLKEIFLIETISFFFKKKVLYFFFLNFVILSIMLINLSKLYKSINLIYALLHFLLFAIFSGLLILLWGNTYIAFCVLLIYGAAIPVLALYIIMLVNVDLIQRLFFFDLQQNNVIFENQKKIIFSLLILFYFIFSLRDINFTIIIAEYPLINEIYKNIFFLILTEKYFNSTQFSFGYTTIYDLVLSFYSSDIDKVSSSAFKLSFNELFALVFLLLIAIIIVISISWPAADLRKFSYENIIPDYKKFYKGFNFFSIKIKKKINHIENINKFLFNWSFPAEIHGNRLNSVHDPIYIHHHYYTRFGFVGLDTRTTDMHGWLAVDPEPDNPNDPWSEWFKVYNKMLFRDYLEENKQVRKFLGKPASTTDWESFTNEEIYIYKGTHTVYL